MMQRFPRLASLIVLLMAVITAVPGLAQTPAPLLDRIFQDHAVLQRETQIPVWGTAEPGATVTVELGDRTTTTEADADGRWHAQLPAMASGGPYTLEARSSTGRSQTAADVLVGDVFLCSGQSNMELTVSRTLNERAEVAGASNDRIRMLTVGHTTSAVPQDTFSTALEWQLTTPETVGSFSAACYYFARELQQHVDVPMGLINSTWGGSNIRAWMNADAVRKAGGYDEMLELLQLYGQDERAAQQAFGERWEAWWQAQAEQVAGRTPWQPGAEGPWKKAPEGLGDWQQWPTPDLRGHTGMAWFRTTIDLTAEQAQHDATLALGALDEVDQTWINGQIVGNTFGWSTPRTYSIPAELLHEGENTVVVNVLNTWGSGGMLGDPSRRALTFGDGVRIPLDDWQYRKVPSAAGSPPRAPWESVAGLTTIHNAMVAPLHHYGLQAVLWYQGESNTGEAGSYQGQMEALIAQWRAQFGAETPVLIVQLANFGTVPTAPTESGWAEVREAQRLATEGDPRAAYVVTIDIGTPYDIHPANKQEVGRRLARAARRVVYGEQVTPSGPAPVEANRRDDAVAVTFDDVDGGLVAHGHDAPIGFELCGSEPGSCRYVDAQIEGEQVLLPIEANGDVTHVRYCWADSPICTLYDEAGLPATPFELRVDD